MSEMLEERVRRLVCDVFLGGDRSFPLERDMSLIENGICDSMGLVQLAQALEIEFAGVKIRDQDISHAAMGTIQKTAELLTRLGAKP